MVRVSDKTSIKSGFPSPTVIFIDNDEEENAKFPESVNHSKSTSESIGKRSKSSLARQSPRNEYAQTQTSRNFKTYLFSEKSVLRRLVGSLIPPFGAWSRVSVDKEGSFLSAFFLFATLWWGIRNNVVSQFKDAGTGNPGVSRVEAFVTAFGIVVGYICCATVVGYTLSRLTKTRITLRQLLCVLSYGLFGHAVTLLICELSGEKSWFLSIMTVIGGLDSFRICLVLIGRTRPGAWAFIVTTPIALIHLLFLVYLHFQIMS